MRSVCLTSLLVALSAATAFAADGPAPDLARDVLPLLKSRCVKCHGPAKQEAGLRLNTAGGMARGGENGAVVAPANLDGSLLWHRVEADEMPPEDPLPEAEKEVLRRWIAAGAAGLPDRAAVESGAADHWAFRTLAESAPPAVRDSARVRTPVDRYILARLDAAGLAPNAEADRATLLRRASFDLTGLPPLPAEIEAFLADRSTDAYERMIDRLLASPHYGERWGKYWLDAAGYADSNGYFNADTDRPLAYRYRDYVVRAINDDKPFDRFVLEQLAGDELSGFVAGQDATPEMITLLEATHYLRNGQDGTGESDGNDEELRIDRYAALEATSQIVGSSLLGLTLGCAKCHDHKFEPISQRDYYRLQSVFYPALNVQDWLKPNDRFLFANLLGELARWEERAAEIDRQIVELRGAFAQWVREHRPAGTVVFHDEFDESRPLAENWSNTAPGDDKPAGETPVVLDASDAPGATAQDGQLRILESGSAGDRCLSTRRAFDWTPDGEGQWIQVTFDLVADRVAPEGAAAARIAYFIALHDFDDSGSTGGGNVLIDGNPEGGAALHFDYPGDDTMPRGDVGVGKYEPGHNYGLRVTNVGRGNFRLEHLVDCVGEEKRLEVRGDELPDGGFGFEYCCGRSFVVDNVIVEQSAPGAAEDAAAKELAKTMKEKRRAMEDAVQEKQRERGERPGKIACVFERAAQPPDVFLLERGNYGSPGEKVTPAPLEALAEDGAGLAIQPPSAQPTSSGRRLAWARWLMQPGSRAAALVARVQVNRAWQAHFGAGIVATTDNLGTSGAAPSHAELLDYLASRFAASGWSMKALHREIMLSSTYRQASTFRQEAFDKDPEDRLLWRFPLRRLDGEALRDAMLAVSGQLDRRMGGPYVPTERDAQGEVVASGGGDNARRRTLYMQQRRTQTLSFIGVFDAPSIVFNCVQRPTSTIPLQSLSLLNSQFVAEQSTALAERILREAQDDAARLDRAFLLASARGPTAEERTAAEAFLAAQHAVYAGSEQAALGTWIDFCHMLLASNQFLYVE